MFDDFFSNAYHSSTSLESFAISLYHYINTVLSIQQTVVHITFNSQQNTTLCWLSHYFTDKGRVLGNGPPKKVYQDGFKRKPDGIIEK